MNYGWGVAFFCAAIEAITAMSAVPLKAQVERTTTLELIRPNGISARATALADAYTASTYDISSMYWNPAALSFLERSSVLIDHQQEVATSIMHETLAFPVFASRTDYLAIGSTLFNLGYFTSSEFSNARVLQYGVDVAYARTLLPSFSIGGQFSSDYGTTNQSALWVFSSSFGLLYAPSEDVHYSAVLGGIGSALQYTHTSSLDYLSEIRQSVTLEIGAMTRFPSSPKPEVISIYVGNEKIFIDNSGVRYKGGIEYWPWQYLALRLGYVEDPSFASARFGLGVRIDKFRLDYASVLNHFDERFHQLSVSYDLWQQSAGYIR